MKLIDIANQPTCVDEIPRGCKGVHESTLRAWHIVSKVKHLLSNGVPGKIVLELIAEMEQSNKEPT